MTRSEFDALCSKYLIHPAIALENEDIVAAIKEKDATKVEDLLKNNF